MIRLRKTLWLVVVLLFMQGIAAGIGRRCGAHDYD